MLNIDSNYQFLFIHIPKCAGTSIESFFGYDYDNNKYIESDFKIGHPKHMTLNEYSSVLSKKLLDNIFKFTIIRNPFDLVLSQYYYGLYNEKTFWNGKNDYEYKKNITFNDYIIFIQNNKRNDIKERLSTNVYSLDEYIISDNVELDFIGRYENLNEDIKKIYSCLDIEYKELPFENKSKINKLNYKDYYNNQTKDLVYKIFKDELKKYNYEF